MLEDELPGEVDFLDVDPDADCDESNNLVTCDFTVANGEQQKVQILVEPQEDGTITNTAQIFRANDLNTPLDEASEDTTVDDNGGGGGGGGGGDGNKHRHPRLNQRELSDLQAAVDDLNSLDDEIST